MNQLSKLMHQLKNGLRLIGLVCAIIITLSITTKAQEDYSKRNQKHQHATYKKHESRLVHACGILGKKRSFVPHKPIFASNKRTRPNMAERSILSIDKSEVTADASPKKTYSKVATQPKPGTEPTEESKPTLKKEPKIEQISEKKLEELHRKEDEVLAENKLPLPNSSKQAEVRKKVADKLASKTNVYPLTLDPLFFEFNQDEFSVVDMEPFLMAAEYALQGRTVLIEGHTDSRGQDDFNLKLSIKRVQKIRQLMLDMGVPDERISVVGYGEELSNKKTTNESVHQNFRRVDFTVF
jgi:outer membrane protein OmpA-like peptidoglycan-associated protein